MSKTIKHAMIDTSGKIHVEYYPEPDMGMVNMIKVSELQPDKVQTIDQARIEILEIDYAKLLFLFKQTVIAFQAVTETIIDRLAPSMTALQALLEDMEASKPKENETK